MFLTWDVNAREECDVLSVGGRAGWSPVAYFSHQTQKEEGIAHDFVKYIGYQLKIPVKIDTQLPWKRLMSHVKIGLIDMFAAIYWTKERAKLYGYSEPYFVNEARIFVKKGKEFPFKQFDDLILKTGGIPDGGSFGEEFDSFAKAHHLNLEGLSNKYQMTQMVLRGRIDYFIQDYLDGMVYLKENELQNQIIALPTPVSVTNIHFAFSRKSPCHQLIPAINKIINKAKRDGTLQKIVDKYIK